MKTCTKCGETKPLSEFSKNAQHKDGHQSQCRVCASARRKELLRSNPERKERELKRIEAWKATHPEEVKKSRLRQVQKRYLKPNTKRWWPD